jgi:hypothetical protein
MRAAVDDDVRSHSNGNGIIPDRVNVIVIYWTFSKSDKSSAFGVGKWIAQ